MKNSLIFIGSTHGFLDDFSKEKEIIEKVNPEYILSEELENITLNSKEKYKELFNKKEISNMTQYSDVENLIRLGYKKNINLIGIDLHNFGYNNEMQEKIKNKQKLTEKEKKELNKIIKSRERNHLSRILEYKKKTSKPIVIIVGSWHLRENSFLRKKLKNYNIIMPCDKEGNPLFAPDKKKEFKYKEIISNNSE